MPRNADFIRKLQIKLMWYYTQLTRFVARGPRASQCPLYQKTTNQVNVVLYPINPICSARSPCLAMHFIRKLQVNGYYIRILLKKVQKLADPFSFHSSA